MSNSLEQISPVKLIEHAAVARDRAYAPYSHYKVGAALITGDGLLFPGCNVENAAYGETICAERVAITSAVAAGHRDFVAIAVVTKDGGSPCGACRQVMAEFSLDMTVYLADEHGEYRKTTVRELLPNAFSPTSLDK